MKIRRFPSRTRRSSDTRRSPSGRARAPRRVEPLRQRHRPERRQRRFLRRRDVHGQQPVRAARWCLPRILGNASSNSSISPNVTEAINPAYTVTAPPGPVDVAEGGSVAITVTVPPLGGSYNNSVTLTASGLPNGATWRASILKELLPGSTGAQTTMTVSLAGAKSTTSVRSARRSP